MIFEGSEKKAEILFHDTNLLTKEESYWHELVSLAQAQILSSTKSEHLHAYLLSESSLFVWKDRVLLITCGTTTLVKAVEKLINDYGINSIVSIIFQRKNEYCGQMQKSSFFDDVKALDKYSKGNAFRLGNYDEHHLFLYHLDKEYIPKKDDTTLELLTYNLNTEAIAFLTSNSLDADRIRNYFKLPEYFPNFQIDDYIFDPYGYSVNGISNGDYFTIHITPQDCHSYVSFETSLPFDSNITLFAKHLIKNLSPEAFDLITFTPISNEFSDTKSKKEEITSLFNGYHLRKQIQTNLQCGYAINFNHCFRPNIEQSQVTKL